MISQISKLSSSDLISFWFKSFICQLLWHSCLNERFQHKRAWVQNQLTAVLSDILLLFDSIENTTIKKESGNGQLKIMFYNNGSLAKETERETAAAALNLASKPVSREI